MSGSIRWLMGLFSLYILLTILGNTLDAQPAYLSVAERNTIEGVQNYTQLSTVGTAVFPSIVGILLPSTFSGWMKMLSWDYSFWYDIDPVTGAKTESPLRIIWFVMFLPLTIGMIVLLLLTARQLLFGA